MSSDLIDRINKMKKTDLTSLVIKLLKRCNKVEKQKTYKGPTSLTYCGKSSPPVGKKRGSPVVCIRKGVGVGKAMGVIEGINKERNEIVKIIKKN
jgi:RIO-like serine/threonine protein kinase